MTFVQLTGAAEYVKSLTFDENFIFLVSLSPFRPPHLVYSGVEVGYNVKFVIDDLGFRA